MFGGGHNAAVLGAAVTPALERGGFPRPIRKGADAAGELGDIIRAGYTAFGAAGAHPQFHTPADDAGTTSQETLLPAARALYDALQAAVQALY